MIPWWILGNSRCCIGEAKAETIRNCSVVCLCKKLVHVINLPSYCLRHGVVDFVQENKNTAVCLRTWFFSLIVAVVYKKNVAYFVPSYVLVCKDCNLFLKCCFWTPFVLLERLQNCSSSYVLEEGVHFLSTKLYQLTSSNLCGFVLQNFICTFVFKDLYSISKAYILLSRIDWCTDIHLMLII